MGGHGGRLEAAGTRTQTPTHTDFHTQTHSHTHVLVCFVCLCFGYFLICVSFLLIYVLVFLSFFVLFCLTFSSLRPSVFYLLFSLLFFTSFLLFPSFLVKRGGGGGQVSESSLAIVHTLINFSHLSGCVPGPSSAAQVTRFYLYCHSSTRPVTKFSI